MKIVGSIQARMGSTRLPGKVLKEIAGKPMLVWHVERLRRSRLLDDVVVATSRDPKDDAIADVCRRLGIACYRGSENDVLGRIAGLIRDLDVDVHAEFFGDSPLTDAHIVDEIVGYYLKHAPRYDFVSNAVETSYPPGQEVSVYRGACLLDADEKTAKDEPLREHVNLHLTRRPERYKIRGLRAPAHYHSPETYLEVDTPSDFDLISAVVEHFLAKGLEYFSLAQILEFLSERPELAASNRDVPRRWKQFRKDADAAS